VVVRFIEFMPLEEGRLWTPEIVVPLARSSPASAASAAGRAAPARSQRNRPPLRLRRRPGEIGIIAPVTQAFCGACSRVRLTSDGKIRTCLFSQVEHDLYGRMRAGETMRNCAPTSTVPFRARKRAITSANRDS
jgi:cyclic pyranopterin phosphate synthase